MDTRLRNKQKQKQKKHFKHTLVKRRTWVAILPIFICYIVSLQK